MKRSRSRPPASLPAACPSPGWLFSRQFTPGDVGRGILLAHLVLSPLVFSQGTVEPFEYNKVALLMLAAFALAGLGLWTLAGWTVAGPWVGRLAEIRSALWETCRDPVVAGFLLVTLSAAISTAT